MSKDWINEGLPHVLYEIPLGRSEDDGIVFLPLPAGTLRGESVWVMRVKMCDSKAYFLTKKRIDFSTEANLSECSD